MVRSQQQKYSQKNKMVSPKKWSVDLCHPPYHHHHHRRPSNEARWRETEPHTTGTFPEAPSPKPPEFSSSSASTNSFGAAFVLPVTRDGRALLTRELRGKEEKFGLLGGKAKPGEDRFACMAREAKEESGGALSETTLLRIGRGAGQLGEAVYFDKSDCVAIKHDLVVPKDLDVDTRFDHKKVERLQDPAQKKKKSHAPTVHTGLEFVSLEKLRDHTWRGKHIHFNASVLCARLVKSM